MAAKESPRPVIGINTDYFLAGKTYSAHARVNAGYFDAVYAAGGLPIILPPLGKEAEIDALLDEARQAAIANALRRAKLLAGAAGAEVGAAHAGGERRVQRAKPIVRSGCGNGSSR